MTRTRESDSGCSTSTKRVIQERPTAARYRFGPKTVVALCSLTQILYDGHRERLLSVIVGLS
eukprot:1357135-Amorphochlora_amoeboformis.AAC.1